MNRTDPRYAAYTRILHDELKTALGCTEPIAVAYACALARKTLGSAGAGGSVRQRQHH